MTDDSETVVRVAQSDARVHDWELVLLALGLSPRVRRTPEGVVLSVPRDQGDRALGGLAAYEKENPPKVQRRDVPIASINLPVGMAVGLLLLGFFALTVWPSAAFPWFECGSANAGFILDGEPWRSVTALTLHADVAHALSNAFAMAVFFGAVAGQLGAGLGGGLVLLAGAGGNLANALLQGPPHDSLGASTAIFGAVGILGSLATIRRRRTKGDRRRAWVAIAAALALLGMLGAGGGGRVDVMAHFFGFAVGSALGIVAAFVFPRRPGPLVQYACAVAGFAFIVYCWVMALR